MTDAADPQSAAEEISDEIGLDLSYFTNKSEDNLLHLALPIGYLLLKWFIEGLVTGAGEAAGKEVEHGTAEAVKRLGGRVRRLFGRRERTSEVDAAVEQELAAETQSALAKAHQELSATSADKVAQAADAYEQALVGYLTDIEKMPGSSAMRIAQRVRTEAEKMLRVPPK